MKAKYNLGKMYIENFLYHQCVIENLNKLSFYLLFKYKEHKSNQLKNFYYSGVVLMTTKYLI